MNRERKIIAVLLLALCLVSVALAIVYFEKQVTNTMTVEHDRSFTFQYANGTEISSIDWGTFVPNETEQSKSFIDGYLHSKASTEPIKVKILTENLPENFTLSIKYYEDGTWKTYSGLPIWLYRDTDIRLNLTLTFNGYQSEGSFDWILKMQSVDS